MNDTGYQFFKKIQIVFKNKTRLGRNFHFKDEIPKLLFLMLLVNFSVDSAMSPILANVWGTWMLELVNILVYYHLQKKQVKPKVSPVEDHFLFCNHIASSDDFSILTLENKKFLLELKESLLIIKDKPFLNRSITSTPLHLFDRA